MTPRGTSTATGSQRCETTTSSARAMMISYGYVEGEDEEDPDAVASDEDAGNRDLDAEAADLAAPLPDHLIPLEDGDPAEGEEEDAEMDIDDSMMEQDAGAKRNSWIRVHATPPEAKLGLPACARLQQRFPLSGKEQWTAYWPGETHSSQEWVSRTHTGGDAHAKCVAWLLEQASR
mmetsp:Transcript_9969/g.21905  ORF Transcript_9969/g.21905 Transcript_9969/m.21905 type:complete len:176 (-) Transcript_9969:55-582(-)